MSDAGPLLALGGLTLIGWIVARATGTWLVWTHYRQWVRGYLAENHGRARSAPADYTALARSAWLAGWDCSHETSPYGDTRA